MMHDADVGWSLNAQLDAIALQLENADVDAAIEQLVQHLFFIRFRSKE
ncbi:hypothetical protein [Pseudomonas oryzihabitans]|nr:hypothetical protein [Pseudomonas oryzihabitans]